MLLPVLQLVLLWWTLCLTECQGDVRIFLFSLVNADGDGGP